MRIGNLSKGDFIKCHDAEEAGYIADRLQGYDWDFVYEHDGQKGIWIEILGEVQGMILDEAIQSLEDEMEKQTALGHSEHIDNLEQMSEWLKELKDYRENTCGDAISRQAVLEAIDTWNKFGYTETGCFVRLTKELDKNYVGYVHLEDVINAILGLPSVSPQQKTGRWRKVSMDKYIQHATYYCECSECGDQHIGQVNYCPNCGAKMEVE